MRPYFDLRKVTKSGQIKKNPEQWRRAVEFLKENDLMKLAEGRHEVTGDGVYANVQTYLTKDTAPFENHRRYIDVQCVGGHIHQRHS